MRRVVINWWDDEAWCDDHDELVDLHWDDQGNYFCPECEKEGDV